MMNLNTLILLAKNGMEMGERLSYSLRMLIVGLGMVFAVLAILWAILEIAHRLLHGVGKEEKPKAAPAPAPAPAPVVATPAPVTPAADTALVAVITAAISAAMESEGTAPGTSFRVVSFRRVSGNNAWNRK